MFYLSVEKNSLRTYILLVATCFLGTFFGGVPGQAAEKSGLEKFREQRRQGMKKLKRQQEKGIADLKQAYEEFYQKRRQAFEEFKQKLKQKWGEANTRLPDKKKWISYSEDYNKRHGADFKAGNAYAEVIVDKNTAKNNPKKVKAQLQEQVKKLVTDVGKTDDIEEEIEKNEKSDTGQKRPKTGKADKKTKEKKEAVKPVKPESKGEQEPVLAGQVKTKDGEEVSKENVDQFAEEATKPAEVKKKEVKNEKGEKKVIVSVKFPLVSDHLRKRAKKYREAVQKYAREYKISASLAFAVIHTESSFNPEARSPIPAYGLMQLVPESGAKDAYRHVYGEKRLLGPDYLYQPARNIELGIGYLHLLMNGYLDGIKNKQSRIYCAVASYNTGAGNLAKTFVGSTNIQRAEKVINRLTPEEVYSKLRSSLPYEETKHYVKRVKNRRPKYEAWEVISR